MSNQRTDGTERFVLSLPEVARQSGCKERQVLDYRDEGILPDPKRFHHKGQQAPDYRWPLSTVQRARLIRGVLDNKGSMLDAALVLLMRGYPCPRVEWTRRALGAHLDRLDRVVDHGHPVTEAIRHPSVHNVNRLLKRRGVLEHEQPLLRLALGVPMQHSHDGVRAELSEQAVGDAASIQRWRGMLAIVPDDMLADAIWLATRAIAERKTALYHTLHDALPGQAERSLIHYVLPGFAHAGGLSLEQAALPTAILHTLSGMTPPQHAALEHLANEHIAHLQTSS